MSMRVTKKGTLRKIADKKKELARLANSLFEPVGKEPYYLNQGKAIRNLSELVENLDAFSETEAPWLASWIEYLGDEETAMRIREMPGAFKEVINERYAELQEFFHRNRK